MGLQIAHQMAINLLNCYIYRTPYLVILMVTPKTKEKGNGANI